MDKPSRLSALSMLRFSSFVCFPFFGVACGGVLLPSDEPRTPFMDYLLDQILCACCLSERLLSRTSYPACPSHSRRVPSRVSSPRPSIPGFLPGLIMNVFPSPLELFPSPLFPFFPRPPILRRTCVRVAGPRPMCDSHRAVCASLLFVLPYRRTRGCSWDRRQRFHQVQTWPTGEACHHHRFERPPESSADVRRPH